jgi:hypothetical protein
MTNGRAVAQGGPQRKTKKVSVQNGPFSGQSVAFGWGPGFDQVGDLDVSQLRPGCLGCFTNPGLPGLLHKPYSMWTGWHPQQ